MQARLKEMAGGRQSIILRLGNENNGADLVSIDVIQERLRSVDDQIGGGHMLGSDAKCVETGFIGQALGVIFVEQIGRILEQRETLFGQGARNALDRNVFNGIHSNSNTP